MKIEEIKLKNRYENIIAGLDIPRESFEVLKDFRLSQEQTIKELRSFCTEFAEYIAWQQKRGNASAMKGEKAKYFLERYNKD